jgi:hypothetical protein
MRIFERLCQNLCRHTMGPERLSAEPARGGLFQWRVSQRCTKCGAESWREAQPHEVPAKRQQASTPHILGLSLVECANAADGQTARVANDSAGVAVPGDLR